MPTAKRFATDENLLGTEAAGRKPAAVGCVSRVLETTYVDREWRRRGSNPNIVSRNPLCWQYVTTSPLTLSGDCQEIAGVDCPCSSSSDTRFTDFATAWSILPSAAQEALTSLISLPAKDRDSILALVDIALKK